MQEGNIQTAVLDVTGMSCDACVQHVSRALQGLAGVHSATVSLAERRADITYDPEQVDTAQMVSAIEEEGYEASPAG